MKSQSDPVQIARMAGKLPVTITENAAKLEPEQDLRAKDQHARFVEGYFDLLGQLHAVA